MIRREVIALLGSTAVSWPVGGRAQHGQRSRQIGVMMSSGSDSTVAQARLAAFMQGLQDWLVRGAECAG